MTDTSTAWGGNPDLHASARSAIDAVAESLGVTPALAEASAYVESGFNPRAVGDSGTSVGAFQLHQGGELDNLPGTPAQRWASAQDPTTNAQVALAEFASVEASNPGLDPGWVAAYAQRPANEASYAAEIDQLLSRGAIPDPGGPSSSPSTGGAIVQTTSWWNPFSWGSDIASSIGKDIATVALNVIFVGAGFGLVAIAANRASNGKLGSLAMTGAEAAVAA